MTIGEAISDCDYYWATAFKTDDAGNAYLAVSKDIFVLKPEGDLAFKLTCGIYISALFKDADGQIYVRYSTGDSRQLANVDFETQNLVSSRDVDEFGEMLGFGANNGETFFLANMGGVHDYEMGNQTFAERFTWLSANIAVNDSDQVIPLSDQRMLLIKQGNPTEVGIPKAFSLIRQMTAAEIAAAAEAKAERERLRAEEQARALENADDSQFIPSGVGSITIGNAYYEMSRGIKQAIVDFNQENPDSRIEVVEYMSGNDEAAYEAALNRLSADIATGNAPDVLVLPPEADFWTYAQKGALQDIYPYLAYEASFDWADYQENIIKAYETDGQLFGLPVAFRIEALVGRQSDLGEMKEWNLDEFIAFADRFPESGMFYQPVKTAVLDMMLRANGENLVDWASDGTGFDRAFLIKMLAFANRFTDDDKYVLDRVAYDRISDGDIRIFPGGISVAGVQGDLAMFGEPVSYVGYPSEQGSGHLVTTHVLIAINAKCENNETAWAFIKHLLSDEFQSSDALFGYPVKKSSLEERIEREKKPQGSVGGGGPDFGFISYELRDVAEEELQIFREVLNRANKVRIHDTQIDAIIKEEAGAYFSGSKTAEQVADIIENRVGIYVKEMK